MASSAQKSEWLDPDKFDVLSHYEANGVLVQRVCKVLAKGENLFDEGQPPRGVYCVNRGKIKVFKRGVDGKEQIVHLGKAGSLLGYRALLSSELYPVTASALEDCSICFIPKEDFLKQLERSVVLKDKLLAQACQELGQMTENITNLAQKQVHERVASALLLLHATYIDEVDEAGNVVLNLTRDTIANLVGTATANLVRVLQRFKENQLISTKGRKITILEVEQLRAVARG